MDFLDEVRGRHVKARAMIASLCKPRNSEGSREWIMTIPVNKERDPDAVIGVSLRDIPKLIDRIAALEHDLLMQVGDTESSKMHAVALNETIATLEKELSEARAEIESLTAWKRLPGAQRQSHPLNAAQTMAKANLRVIASNDKLEAENKRLRTVVKTARRIACPKEPDSSCLEWEIYCALQIELDAFDRAEEEDQCTESE